MNVEGHGAFLALVVTAAVVLGGASTATADETTPREAQEQTSSTEDSQNDSEEEEADEESDDEAGSAIVNPSKTGLQLGSGESSTDDALASLDRARDESKQSETDESEASDEANASDSGPHYPCEPYPSCARADLGSHAAQEVDVEKFQAVAKAHSEQIRNCYEKALGENEADRIVVAFTVDAEGDARDIQVEESTVDAEKAQTCAQEAVSNWKFPKPSEFGYESLKVTHPFTFRTK